MSKKKSKHPGLFSPSDFMSKKKLTELELREINRLMEELDYMRLDAQLRQEIFNNMMLTPEDT